MEQTQAAGTHGFDRRHARGDRCWGSRESSPLGHVLTVLANLSQWNNLHGDRGHRRFEASRVEVGATGVVEALLRLLPLILGHVGLRVVLVARVMAAARRHVPSVLVRQLG